MNKGFCRWDEWRFFLTILQSRFCEVAAPLSTRFCCNLGTHTNGILAAILVGSLLLTYSQVYAHGGGTPRLTNEPAGPYRLYVWSSPEPLRVGEVHMTLAVVLPPEDSQTIDESSLFNDLDQVVTGADIELTFVPVSPSSLSSADDVIEAIRVKVFPSEINPLYYEMDTELPIAGEWQISIDIAGKLGTGTATFPAQIEDALLLDWGILAGVVVLLGFIILIGRSFSGQKRGGNT